MVDPVMRAFDRRIVGALGLDVAKAADFTVKRLQSTWGPPSIGEPRVMKMPPEKYVALSGPLPPNSHEPEPSCKQCRRPSVAFQRSSKAGCKW